jgi:hypothetical protein
MLHESYKMVVVSGLTTLLLSCGILFYRYIFPKKKITLLILLILISILPIISIFRPGVYESGDFNIHVYRNISFYDALQEGQWKPTWSRDLNATYGYPAFLVEAPLGDYIPALFHSVGFSFILSFKLLLALSFIASGITMYFWTKEELDETAGFVSAIFYLFAPYHLVDLHFRAHPGDILAFVFLPLCALGMKKMSKKSSYGWFIFTVASLALLVLSHPIALAGFIYLFFYAIYLYFRANKKLVFLALIALTFLFGLCLSAFFWLPVNFEGKYMITALYPIPLIFQQFHEYIYSPWRYGFLFQGPNGELSFIIGYIQWLLILLGVYLYFKKKLTGQSKSFLGFFLLVFFVTFLLMQQISEPIWAVLPLLKNFEISYRLMFLVVFYTAAIAGIITKHFAKVTFTRFKLNFVLTFCIIAILTTILNWGQRRVITTINDQSLRAGLPESTIKGEGGPAAMPRWVDPKNIYMKDVPPTHLQILQGKGTVKQVIRTSIHQEYVINANTDLYLKENTLYYPGWTVLANNKSATINYQNPKYKGVMTLHLKKGIYSLDFQFRNTPVRTIAETISGMTFILLILPYLYLLAKKFVFVIKSAKKYFV